MCDRNIVPVTPAFETSFRNIIANYGKTCFEARNVSDAALLLEKMINEGDTIWLGIAGAGIVGGLGGYIIELIKRGYCDVICTTGAQVYHDLHFAFGLPVKQGHLKADDNKLRKAGITRIFDMYISEEKTLLAQDAVIRQFCSTLKDEEDFSSADFNYLLGRYVLENAGFPEYSFLAQSAKCKVPVFYDSGSNHSIGMNIAALYLDGKKINILSSLDVLESAAIAYSSRTTGFFELGGGGPKNFIQQTGPTIKQILGINFEGADRGIQITTALERDGGLSGCTFSEGVTWGKYKDASKNLVQIFGEYSVILPIIAGFVLESCESRPLRELIDKKGDMLEKLKRDRKR